MVSHPRVDIGLPPYTTVLALTVMILHHLCLGTIRHGQPYFWQISPMVGQFS